MKTRREIVSPAKAKAIAKHELSRATQTEQLKNEIQKRESFVAPDGNADVTNPEEQKGRYMTREDVVRKLQKLNPNLLYEQSTNYPEFGGLYIEECSFDTSTLLVSTSTKKHLCGIPHEYVAEFDVRIVVKDRVPDPTIPLHWIEVPQLEGHIPGWRSTIIKLAKRGYINLTAAENEFQVYHGRSSQRWQMAVN